MGTAGRTGYWGDQADDSYRNPILDADYPDVDIERLGDTYYMITSTIHYAPGMMLLESADLVNWSIIGHVFDRLDWRPEYGPDMMKGYPMGVWAGDLAYHDGTWYCYFIDYSSGLYVSSARDIRGPWSKAVCMLEKKVWTDPAVYWDDEEGTAYLVCNFGPTGGVSGAENEIRMFAMSLDGMRLLDEGRVIYRGPGAEAAKIYRIDGLFYIFLAEWQGNDRKQLVLRGSSIYGPFERKVVMERGSGLERSTSQGSLVRAKDGSWWLTHQLIQARVRGADGKRGPSTDESYEGRSQWLVPVTWKDGWPVPGEDPDGTGIGTTVHRFRKPIPGYQITAPQTDDDFDSPVLGHQWEWNHNPRDDCWSLTEHPGRLRLRASVPVEEGGFWNASNTLSQRLMGKGRGTATARIELDGMEPGQVAGLCHHSGTYALLGVRLRPDGSRGLFLSLDGEETPGPEVKQSALYFRTDSDAGRASFSWSTDGESWIRIGPDFRLTFGRWRGDRIGFFCWNETSAAGYVDVDWFRYEYDGPKGSGSGIGGGRG